MPLPNRVNTPANNLINGTASGSQARTPGAGETAIVWGVTTSGGAGVSVSGAGATWTQIGSWSDGTRTSFAFRGTGLTSGTSQTVTVSFSNTTTCRWSWLAVTGMSTITPDDQTGSNTVASSTRTSTNCVNPALNTPANVVCVAGLVFSSAPSTIAAPSGWTGVTAGSGTSLHLSYFVTSAGLSSDPVTVTHGSATNSALGFAATFNGDDQTGGGTSISVTDTGSGSDGTPVIACGLTSTDSTSGSDSLGNVSCTLAQADSGAGLDSAPSCSVSLSLLESSQASDFLGTLDVLLAAITDSGSGSDFVAQIQQGILIAIAEAGLGTDAITNLACSLSTADDCTGADEAAVSVQLQQILDACVGSDTVQCAVSLSLIETAAGVDAVACSVQLSLSDSATGLDLLTGLAAVIAIAEQCGGLDTINVQTGAGASGRVATITFTAQAKSAAFAPAAKSATFTPNL
jgi:hypothetical protein